MAGYRLGVDVGGTVSALFRLACSKESLADV